MSERDLRLEIKSDMRELRKELRNALVGSVNDLKQEMLNQRDTNDSDRRLIFDKLDKISDQQNKLKLFNAKIVGMFIGGSFVISKFDGIINWLTK